MRYPLLALSLAWIIGILIAQLPNWQILVIAFGLVWVVFQLAQFQRRQPPWPNLIVLFVLSTLVFGALRMSHVQNQRAQQINTIEALSSDTPVAIHGRVLSGFRPQGGYQLALLSDAKVWQQRRWHSVPGNVSVSIPEEGDLPGQPGQPGDQLRLLATFQPIRRDTLPGLGNPLFYLEFQNVFSRCWLYSSRNMDVIVESSPTVAFVFRRWLEGWRDNVQTWINSAIPAPQRGLAFALLMGHRGDISSGQYQQLRTTGLLHLISLSGLHVTAFLVSLPLLLKLLGIRRRQRALVAMLIGIGFLVFVGIRAPSLRAVIMGEFFLLGVLLDRPRQTLNNLGGAALLILLVHPTQLFAPGFQLSFMAVGSILMMSPIWLGSDMRAWIYRQSVSCRPYLLFHAATVGAVWLVDLMLISLIVNLALFPFLAWHMQSFSLLGVVGNLVAVPIAFLVTLAGGLVVFGGWRVPLVNSLLREVVTFGLHLLQLCLDIISRWEWGLFLVPRPSIYWAAIYLALLLGLLLVCCSRKNRRFARVVLAGGFCLLSLLEFSPAPDFRACFLDVGQGDCCLLQFPDGHNLLIDTGPPPGKHYQTNQIVPRLVRALLVLGVNRLDAVLITHPEFDHCGHLCELARYLPIDLVLATGDWNRAHYFKKLADQLERLQIPVERLLQGDRITAIPETTIEVLWPDWQTVASRVRGTNERALVCLVSYRDLDLLFTGDVDQTVEEICLPMLSGKTIEVLKVAHHGSKYSTSPTMLRSVQPKLAIISCGPNRFGHPSPEVLGRLEENGIHHLTTRQAGSIFIVESGRGFEIRSSSPSVID